jgi:type I restriction enzyme S subunit
LDQLSAKKRDIKRAAMQQLLSGQKRLPGFGERVTFSTRTALGEFPDDWQLVPLSRVSAFITKGSTPTTYGFDWKSVGVLFLRSECVSERGLDLSESMFIAPQAHQFLKRSEVKGGDILMTITKNVGRGFIFQTTLYRRTSISTSLAFAFSMRTLLPPTFSTFCPNRW